MLLKLSDFKFTRFFARLLSAELSCPRCGSVTRINTRRSGKTTSRLSAIWDPRASRWTCPGCSLVLVLGVIAWSPDVGSPAYPPHDQIPTLLESAGLRHLRGWKVEGERIPARQEVNVVVIDEPDSRGGDKR